MQQIFSMTLIAVALIGGLSSTTAQAADQGFYGYVSVGSSNSDRKGEGDTALTNLGATAFTSSMQSTSSGYKVQLGYQINSNFAVEGGYVDMGKFSYHATVTAPTSATRDIAITATGLNLDAVGRLPILDELAVFGKLGVVSYNLKYACQATGIACLTPTRSSNGTPLHFGLGMDWNLTQNWFARAEYEIFKNVGERSNATGSRGTSQADVKMANIGIGYKF